MSRQAPISADRSIIQQLKRCHLKATTTRKTLLALLNGFTQPFTADDVLNKLHKQKYRIHKATVYRDLHHFVAHGLLTELTLEKAACHFYEIPSSHHHHFVCQQCFSITDLFPGEVEQALERFEEVLQSQQLIISHHHLKFYGTCSACQQKAG